MDDIEKGGKEASATEGRQNEDVFFEKVEIHVPRSFIRITNAFYNYAFCLVRVLGGDRELTELRTMLFCWRILTITWSFCSILLFRCLDAIMKHETYTYFSNTDIHSAIRSVRPYLDNKDGSRSVVLNSILDIMEAQEKRIEALSLPWETHDFIVIFLVEMTWVMFFPYVLKATILPIVRRILFDQNNRSS